MPQSKTLKILFYSLLLTPFFYTLAFAELSNGMEADVVIGQPDFYTNTLGIGPDKLEFPEGGAFSDGKRLFVADTFNHRVLIWNAIPAQNNMPADVVLGQQNFTTDALGTTAATMNYPEGVFSDGQRLFVSDFDNNRVLIWNSIPTRNGAPADIVLGQSNFVSGDVNQGGAVAANTMRNPGNLMTDGKRLYVTDVNNHRVLIWNSVPTRNNTPADIVLGQPNFVTGSSGLSATSFNRPLGIFSDGKRLIVSELTNNRILIWNSIPTSNNTRPDIVLGQPNFTSNTALSSRSGIGSGHGVFSDGKRLFACDRTNSRVLIWNTFPTRNAQPADQVIGQADFLAADRGVGKNRFNEPTGVFATGKNLIITDEVNHRILIFNLSGGSSIKLGPQFEQGKAVLGKVFNDMNGNGFQDKGEAGLDGVKVVSDTGIYAITDEDGKYHFPFMETGQRVLKIDTDTLPEGAIVTTDNPYKVVVTKGVLTKVSFGVRLDSRPQTTDPREDKAIATAAASNILLKASVSQESSQLKPRLSVSAALLSPQDKEYQKLSADPQSNEPKVFFTIDCNYFLFIKHAELKIYDENQKLVKTLELPQPLPLYYEIPVSEFLGSSPNALVGDPGSLDSRLRGNDKKIFYYQLSVFDAKGSEDRTSVGVFEILESKA